MKIDSYIDKLLEDLEEFKPDTLTSIVDFVKSRSDYNTIAMLVRNSKKSAQCIIDHCIWFVEGDNQVFDVRLAGLLVILAEIDSDLVLEWASRISEGSDKYKWSRSMAATYLIHKEVLNEAICQSA